MTPDLERELERARKNSPVNKQILTGNILTSGLNEIAVIVPLYAAVGLLHWLLRRRLTGEGSLACEFVFYATFGVVVTSSVAIAGVLLVFSFLIIPAAIGLIFASSFARQLGIGWLVGIAASAVILILMLDQAIFTVSDMAVGIARLLKVAEIHEASA